MAVPVAAKQRVSRKAARCLRGWLLPATLALLMASCAEPPSGGRPAGDVGESAPAGGVTLAPVTDERLVSAHAEPGNWLNHGRTWNEQRFSPLDAVNRETVSRLRLAWHLDLPTRRGLEATPLIADGRMYTTGTWSRVYAVDAASGRLLWQYDPDVPAQAAIDACCDVVNRGVALWRDRVYVGTLDGRLVALDAASGEPVWTVQTTPKDLPYTITGAPRIADGKVLIGNGGAEFNARGYISAYDAETGALAWRFYTVPGNPAEPFEHPVLEQAAATWSGRWWSLGGGGTVWDAISYDPELGLVYIGVGNGTPWNRDHRSPGGGDNLFLASIVALDVDSGDYVWHYQTTPGETWDFTATQHIMLAELEWGGVTRQVLMQAPKNGFFYVLDRHSGELLSAEPFVEVNWATHVDMRTGRPVEVDGARYGDAPFTVVPAAPGGHNWQPMAFHPGHGLVYIPAQDSAWSYQQAGRSDYARVKYSTGIDAAAASMPEDPAIQREVYESVRGHLIAWDPVAGRARWTVEHPVPWNGGVLATAGDLVFQGTADGAFKAFAAGTGEKLWSYDVQTAALAGPVSYAVNGEQYIAVMTGWGSAFAIEAGIVARWAGVPPLNRILAFRLDGGDALPPPPVAPPVPEPPPATADPQTVALGKALYHEWCTRCHGDAAVSGGVLPDLRHLDTETHADWQAIVLGGARYPQGMPGFAGHLSAEASEAIHAYVIKRAHDPVYLPSRE